MTKQQQHIQERIDAYAQQAVMEDLDLWPAIRATITERQRAAATPAVRRRSSKAAANPRLRVVSLALVTLLAVIAVAWGLRPRPVSAAVILARANEALGNMSTFGLNSFIGRIEGHGLDAGSGEGGIQPYEYTFEKGVRHQAPDRVRVDECVTVAGQTRLCHLVVSDGATGWLYVDGQQQASRFAAGAPGGITFVAADQRSLVANPNAEPRVRLLGSEQVAGRSAYVLEIAADPATGAPASTVWIDQEFYLELRHETRDQQGNLIIAWRYTSFEPDPDLDPAAFSFSPPEGVVVEEGYPLNSNVLYITPELRFVYQGVSP